MTMDGWEHLIEEKEKQSFLSRHWKQLLIISIHILKNI